MLPPSPPPTVMRVMLPPSPPSRAMRVVLPPPPPSRPVLMFRSPGATARLRIQPPPQEPRPASGCAAEVCTYKTRGSHGCVTTDKAPAKDDKASDKNDVEGTDIAAVSHKDDAEPGDSDKGSDSERALHWPDHTTGVCCDVAVAVC